MQKYLLNAYYASTILGPRDKKKWIQEKKSPCTHGTYILVGETDN